MNILSLAYLSVVCLELAALSGGTFYAFGGIATDIKIVGNFTQEEINLIGSSCYTGGLSLQIVVGYLSTVSIIPTITGSLFLGAVGWGWLAATVLVAPGDFTLNMIGFLITSLGVVSPVIPIFSLFRTFMKDPRVEEELLSSNCMESKQLVTLSASVFIVLFAASGGLASAIYVLIDVDPQIKLYWFYIGSCFATIITLFFVTLWAFLLIGKNETKEEKTKLLGEKEEPPLPLRLRRLLMTEDLWVAMFGLFFMFGPTVNFYNNAGSMVLAVGGDDNQLVLIFLEFCAGQVVGRIITTAMITGEEKNHWRSTLLFVLFPVLLFISSLILWQMMTLLILHILSAVNALVYGSLWVLMFELPIPGKLFDPQHQEELGFGWGPIYGLLCLSPAFSPLCFNVLSGILYDRQTSPGILFYFSKTFFSLYFLFFSLLFIFCFSFLFLSFLSIPDLSFSKRMKTCVFKNISFPPPGELFCSGQECYSLYFGICCVLISIGFSFGCRLMYNKLPFIVSDNVLSVLPDFLKG